MDEDPWGHKAWFCDIIAFCRICGASNSKKGAMQMICEGRPTREGKGVGAQGAEDAWWRRTLDHELARLEGKEATGGGADIYKCFGQIQRKLLNTLLDRSE